MTPTNTKTQKTTTSKRLVKKTAKDTKQPEESKVEIAVVETVPAKKVSKRTKKSDVVSDVEVESKGEVKKSKRVKKEETSEEAKASKPSKSKKAQDPPQEEGEQEKKVKKVKKINNKPTPSDTCGLNLSIAKVKNIMSNLCINADPWKALKEMKEHRIVKATSTEAEIKENSGKRVKKQFTFTLDGLSQETLDYIEFAHKSNIVTERETLAKLNVKNMTDEQKKAYNVKRKEALVAHQLKQSTSNLFQLNEFDLNAFNLEWDSGFYDKLVVVDYHQLKDMELYAHCANLINKLKVRFNADSKIYITAFIELIIKQLIVNGTVNCITSGKKIIKLEHALDTVSEGFKERFSLYPMITNLESFHKVADEKVVDDASTEEHEEKAPAEEEEEEPTDRKYQFKYYVYELCRTVKRELAKENNPEDFTQSVYYSTSISKIFKNFCSNIIVDLIRMFGELLKIEVSSRNVKTVNYTIIETLLQVFHLTYGLSSEFEKSTNFVQERYSIYQNFVKDRKDGRLGASDEAEVEADESC